MRSFSTMEKMTAEFWVGNRAGGTERNQEICTLGSQTVYFVIFARFRKWTLSLIFFA